MIKFLVDAVFPDIQAAEVSADVGFEAWDSSDERDDHLIRHASEHGLQGIIFWGQRSLAQPNLCQLAEELCITLVAVVAADPFEAKRRLLHNAERLRKLLSNTEHRAVLVFANTVRPFRPLD